MLEGNGGKERDRRTTTLRRARRATAWLRDVPLETEARSQLGPASVAIAAARGRSGGSPTRSLERRASNFQGVMRGPGAELNRLGSPWWWPRDGRITAIRSILCSIVEWDRPVPLYGRGRAARNSICALIRRRRTRVARIHRGC